MRHPLILVTILVITAVSMSEVRAEETQFTAAVDKQSVRVNEEIHLNVRVIGVRGSIQAPRLPSLEGFEIFYSGRASRFSFINNKSESLTEFNYVLIPRSVGRFILRPIEIKVDDRVYRTNELEITVEHDQFAQSAAGTSGLPSASVSRPPVSGYAPVPSTAAPPAPPMMGAATKDELDENLFLKVSANQLSVYTNQQLILTYSLFTRYDTRYEGFVEEPETSGFWIEEFPMEQNIGRDTEMVDGKRFVRADVKKLALFPTAPGQYVIKPGSAKTSVQIEERPSSMLDEFFNDSFFSGGGLFSKRVEKILNPPPIQIQVKPLPEEGKPKSFKGAVGEFRMATSVDKRVVNQNEAVTLQIALEGEGNIETLAAPLLPEMTSAKIYESDTQTQLFRAQNVIAGKKTFEIVAIPTEAGELTIPSLEFSYFNPKNSSYVVLKSDPYKIKVNPSLVPPPVVPKNIAQNELGDAKKSIRLEGEDIQFIKERFSGSQQTLSARLVVGLGVFDGLLTLVCAGFLFQRRRQEYLDRNAPVKRDLYAKRNAARGLKHLSRLAKSPSEDSKSFEVFFEECAKVLNLYLADKLNLSAHSLTQSTVDQNLLNRGVAPEVIDKIHQCFEACDMVRFGKMGVQNVDRQAFIQKIQNILKTLEQNL